MSDTLRAKFLLIWTLVVYVSGVSNAFLMDDTCLAEPPCTCTTSAIDCRRSHLTSVPRFSLPSATSQPILSRLTIRLDYNDIVEVGSRAFFNLTLTNASDINIYLYYNNIHSIHEDAFDGIGHSVTYLDLRYNNLSHIPEALGVLSNLKSLNLYSNPLLSMSSSSIFTVGKTVDHLIISMNLFTEWPAELRYFQRLTDLDTDGYSLPYLPLSAMHGLEATLSSLYLINSHLERIPSAVCQLEKIATLWYTENTNTQFPIFQACDHAMTTVSALYLHSNGLDRFPDLLHFFPSVNYLFLHYNNIGTIDSSLIPPGHPLQYLYLNYNDLYSIPRAIVHFQQLTILQLSGNSIKSIEENALEGLSKLRYLYLSNNPVEYIANTAFDSQPFLSLLYLENTNLRTIPLGLTSLSFISDLNLEGSPIECSCELSHLKTWYTNQTTIRGKCANTDEQIKTYLDTNLSQCP